MKTSIGLQESRQSFTRSGGLLPRCVRDRREAGMETVQPCASGRPSLKNHELERVVKKTKVKTHVFL